jgi:hypothetical protein
LIRVARALLLGSLAAAVGAGVYRMIMLGTGRNFALIAILIGYTVGGAVRTESRERGGRFYQFLAVFLTYSALAGMYLPEARRALTSGSEEVQEAKTKVERESQKKATSDHGATAKAQLAQKSIRPEAVTRLDAGEPRPALAPQHKTKPAAPDANKVPARSGQNQRPRSAIRLLYALSMLVLASLLVFGLIYCVPVVVGIHSPISLLIFAIGLWQAWKMNRPSEPPITGPYRIRA